METCEAILEAACRLFPERGFSGTSVSDLAEAAGVNKSLIYHHYGSKEGLWRAVLEHYFMQWAPAWELLGPEDDGDLAGLTELARGEEGFFRHLMEHPLLVRLMAWQNLEGDPLMKPSERVVLERVAGRMRRLQESGALRSGLDVKVIPIAVVSLFTQWFMTRERYREWLCGDDPDPNIDERFLEGIMDLILRGMLPEGGDGGTDAQG